MIKIIVSSVRMVLDFFRDNLYKIIVGITVTIFAYLAIFITLYSLKKLKVDVFSYYPFDRFFPQSGKWSVLYFLLIVIFLILLAFFLFKGGFAKFSL